MKSRIAAFAGLLLSVTGFIMNWIEQGVVSKNSVPLLVMMYMLSHCVRAVFAHYKAVDIGDKER